MFKGLIFFILSILTPHLAFAQDGLVGFEWTFTNSDIVRNFKNMPTSTDMPPIPGRAMHDYMNTTVQAMQSSPISKASQTWLEEIKMACPDCTVKANTVYTPDGFWFKITKDQTVLEVITEPMTGDQLIQRSEILEDLVWRTAKKAYVVPHKRLGGGHLHLDIPTNFNNDRELFRNFIVDLINRPELFMGGLGLNYFNAPPLSFYSPNKLVGFKKIISDFDKDPTVTIKELMERINTFYKTLPHPLIPTPSDKFQALNFKHLDIGTIEIRGLRPQISAEHAVKLVKLFQSRIAVLSAQPKLLKLRIPDYSLAYQAKRNNGYRVYTHDLAPSYIMAAVKNYAAAGDLEPELYSDFITEELKNDLKIEIKNKKASGSKSAGFCSSFL